jgi:hypothetical protein
MGACLITYDFFKAVKQECYQSEFFQGGGGNGSQKNLEHLKRIPTLEIEPQNQLILESGEQVLHLPFTPGPVQEQRSKQANCLPEFPRILL